MTAEFHIQGSQDHSTATRSGKPSSQQPVFSKLKSQLNAKTVNVTFDENIVQEKTLIKKIQDLGFTATAGDELQREAGV